MSPDPTDRPVRWLVYASVLWGVLSLVQAVQPTPRPAPVPAYPGNGDRMGDGDVGRSRPGTAASASTTATTVIVLPSGINLQPGSWTLQAPVPSARLVFPSSPDGQWSGTRFYIGEGRTCGAHLDAAGLWQPFGPCWAWPARAAEGEAIYGRER